MTPGKTLHTALTGYLPAGCTQAVVDWFQLHPVSLRISRSRRSKLGDFRGGRPGLPSIISVNHDLNPYSFLVTLLHEMAHAEVHLKFKRRVMPHGEEWKQAFRQLAKPFATTKFLPEDLAVVLSAYLVNPLASSMAYQPLALALQAFDPPRSGKLISELPAEALFALPDGRMFKRGEKLRKRYRCTCLNNKRIYLFSPMAEIIPVANKSAG